MQMRKKKQIEEGEAIPAATQDAGATQPARTDRRAEVLRELLRICGLLIADSVNWDDVERRSEELFRGASIQDQQSMLAALDAAIGRVRSGLVKAGGIYRFREIVNE
jgi:hypothetical protein